MSHQGKTEQEQEQEQGGLAAVVRAGMALAGPHAVPVTTMERRALVVQADQKVVDLRMLKRRHVATLHDAPSLIGYTRRHRSEEATVLFVEEDQARFTVAFDYPEEVFHDDEVLHVAVLNLKPTDQWRRLQGVHGKTITQEQFFDLLDEMEEVFMTPQAARVREIVRDFRCHRKIEFRKVINMHSGAVSLQYTDAEEQAAGEFSLPEELVLAVEPFRGVGAFEVKVKTRYRLRDGQVVFQLAIHREERIRELAVDTVVETFTQAVPEVPVLRGTFQTVPL